jgi:hypothetical protein
MWKGKTEEGIRKKIHIAFQKLSTRNKMQSTPLLAVPLLYIYFRITDWRQENVQNWGKEMHHHRADTDRVYVR